MTLFAAYQLVTPKVDANEYRREPGEFNVPGFFESNSLIFTEPPTVTAVGGEAGEYDLDPILTATEVITIGPAGPSKTYEIFFVPSSN